MVAQIDFHSWSSKQPQFTKELGLDRQPLSPGAQRWVQQASERKGNGVADETRTRTSAPHATPPGQIAPSTAQGRHCQGGAGCARRVCACAWTATSCAIASVAPTRSAPRPSAASAARSPTTSVRPDCLRVWLGAADAAAPCCAVARAGFTCAEFKEYTTAPKCRFCSAAVMTRNRWRAAPSPGAPVSCCSWRAVGGGVQRVRACSAEGRVSH